jgi:alpha-galactosidase
MIFPTQGGTADTRLVIESDSEPDRLPVVRWLGNLEEATETGLLAATGPRRGAPLLLEHSRGSYLRPSLRGHRLDGTAWSTLFFVSRLADADRRLTIDAVDAAAQLRIRTEIESLVGGALRLRHELTNTGTTPYQLDGLEVTVPIPDALTELLDFSGRHERERIPQRHPVVDGLWVRQSRRGKPGLDSASLLVAGSAGFGFASGEVVAILVCSSGNATLSIERSSTEGPVLSAGELLLPGELILDPGESYTMPWVVVAAARDGLDALAHSLHTWQRNLHSHPPVQPVTLNVWEAVYFDHDSARLTELADRAARVGVERFVLDDGWFRGRRDEQTGLGDWWVDDRVWPEGLEPLIDHVRSLGMQFGLWFEPEMINPNSDLYRAHPDWILTTGDRIPLLHRNQLVLDLSNAKVWSYLRDRVDAVLSSHRIDYVKWDHNRDLLDAGSSTRRGAPAARQQNLAFYALLDDLRARHPNIAWESCAAGGGRIDLGILERVQRVWTSDMTDALSRQQIQRWTTQFVAPEYLGAHVSAPMSHQTGRTLSLGFRAATALFGAFGVEWDLTEASDDEFDELAWWTALHKRYRPLLHSGRVVRVDTSDPSVLVHGVVADDGGAALIAHLQLDESTHNRGVVIRIPRLDPGRLYALTWASPVDNARMSMVRPLDPAGPTNGRPVTGATLAEIGIWMPRRRPETAQLIDVTAV